MNSRGMPMEQPAYYDPRYGAVSRGSTPYGAYPSQAADPRTQSPPMGATTPAVQEVATPSQLKVKVHCPSAGSSMTLVVSLNISYQSLKDRIDAKLQRSTNVSLSSGAVKLKYLDEGDYISLQSDEDVQTAFESWKEQQRDHITAGQMGEIELFCQ
jgi:cell division control protein 24